MCVFFVGGGFGDGAKKDSDMLKSEALIGREISAVSTSLCSAEIASETAKP